MSSKSPVTRQSTTFGPPGSTTICAYVYIPFPGARPVRRRRKAVPDQKYNIRRRRRRRYTEENRRDVREREPFLDVEYSYLILFDVIAVSAASIRRIFRQPVFLSLADTRARKTCPVERIRPNFWLAGLARGGGDVVYHARFVPSPSPHGELFWRTRSHRQPTTDAE